MNKPYSQACENNKRPILNKLTNVFSNSQHVLEIGSGTGQHAAFFGHHLPHLTWQTSDLSINHEGITLWLKEANTHNVKKPIVIDLQHPWLMPQNDKPVDGLYTANTLHIISWPLVTKFFEGISNHLMIGAPVCIYGPFNYQGKYTSESNAQFDRMLQQRGVGSGIRDIEAITLLANEAGLDLMNDHDMPANNRLLVFTKKR
ncbi:DUF938 domain-containing protein [Algibacillus agarilyticus]|uniref:DUF938 domain-containing protein n=1 Tax=Algibacillus agarilyticus TaxID=2234133 RepID=UPI000DD02863|nr:DUF938 domain-containing protein [Algibacillus agarilyticus]